MQDTESPQNKIETESIINKQLAVMGNAFTLMTALIIVVTLVIGVFSFLRLESLEDKLDKAIEKQDDLLQQKSERLEDKYENMRLQIEDKLGHYETRFEDKINKFTDKSDKNMKNAIDEMNKDFEKLSGESKLKPMIEILYKNNPLNGKVIDITMNNPQHFDLNEISIKNTGTGTAEKMALRFSLSYPIFCGGWSETYPIEGYQTTLLWEGWRERKGYIVAGDKWNSAFRMDDFDISGENIIKKEDMPFKIECKIEIFYEPGIPSVAEFTILLSSKNN